MGCGKSSDAREIIIDASHTIKEENIDKKINKETKENKEIKDNKENKDSFEDPCLKLHLFPDTKNFELKLTRINRDNNYLEIGKEGEDLEAGIISEGKNMQESLDVKLQKHIIPKRLPPIPNPPLIPTTLISKFTKNKKSHKPDQDIIRDLLPSEDKGFDFEGLNEHSSLINHDKMIKQLMKELSIEKKPEISYI